MSTITTDAFGAKVEEYRTRLGLLQKELAGKVGLSPSHLNRIEKGTRKRPGVETVRRMITALRLTQSEAKELVQLAKLSPLVLQQNNFKEKKGVKGAKGNKDAGAEESGGRQSAVGQPANKVSSLSPVYHSPLSISDQQILTRGLAVLEKKLEAAEKNMRDANEELRELRALVEELFSKEEE